MRWLAKPIILLGIVLSIVTSSVMTGLSILEFIQLCAKNNDQIVTEIQFIADVHYYRSLPITWLVVGMGEGIVFIISLFILLFMFRRLQIALAILQEASGVVR